MNAPAHFVAAMPEPYRSRFVAKVQFGDGCWTWIAGRYKSGYGSYICPFGYYAHRIAYTFTVGEIPAGLQIDHLCRNKVCVNPSHLEPVTGAENVRRCPDSASSLASAAADARGACLAGHPYEFDDAGRRRKCRPCANAASDRARAKRRDYYVAYQRNYYLTNKAKWAKKKA